MSCFPFFQSADTVPLLQIVYLLPLLLDLRAADHVQSRFLVESLDQLGRVNHEIVLDLMRLLLPLMPLLQLVGLLTLAPPPRFLAATPDDSSLPRIVSAVRASLGHSSTVAVSRTVAILTHHTRLGGLVTCHYGSTVERCLKGRRFHTQVVEI